MAGCAPLEREIEVQVLGRQLFRLVGFLWLSELSRLRDGGRRGVLRRMTEVVRSEGHKSGSTPPPARGKGRAASRVGTVLISPSSTDSMISMQRTIIITGDAIKDAIESEIEEMPGDSIVRDRVEDLLARDCARRKLMSVLIAAVDGGGRQELEKYVESWPDGPTKRAGYAVLEES